MILLYCNPLFRRGDDRPALFYDIYYLRIELLVLSRSDDSGLEPSCRLKRRHGGLPYTVFIHAEHIDELNEHVVFAAFAGVLDAETQRFILRVGICIMASGGKLGAHGLPLQRFEELLLAFLADLVPVGRVGTAHDDVLIGSMALASDHPQTEVFRAFWNDGPGHKEPDRVADQKQHDYDNYGRYCFVLFGHN